MLRRGATVGEGTSQNSGSVSNGDDEKKKKIRKDGVRECARWLEKFFNGSCGGTGKCGTCCSMGAPNWDWRNSADRFLRVRLRVENELSTFKRMLGPSRTDEARVLAPENRGAQSIWFLPQAACIIERLVLLDQEQGFSQSLMFTRSESGRSVMKCTRVIFEYALLSGCMSSVLENYIDASDSRLGVKGK